MNCLKIYAKDLETLVWKWYRQVFVASLVIQPTLMNRIRAAQKGDKEIKKIRDALKVGKANGFSEDEQGTIWFEKRFCVASDTDLRKIFFQEAHETPYSIRPGNTKTYMDLKERFWWNNMKRDIAEFIGKRDVCRRVKAEH
jgi:hypothetical protein